MTILIGSKLLLAMQTIRDLDWNQTFFFKLLQSFSTYFSSLGKTTPPPAYEAPPTYKPPTLPNAQPTSQAVGNTYSNLKQQPQMQTQQQQQKFQRQQQQQQQQQQQGNF